MMMTMNRIQIDFYATKFGINDQIDKKLKKMKIKVKTFFDNLYIYYNKQLVTAVYYDRQVVDIM